jgi:hypothetical protein
VIRSTYRLNGVDDVNATLTVTMPVKHWKEFQSSLSEKWPNWEFSSKISEMINEANRVFSTSQQGDGSGS